MKPTKEWYKLIRIVQIFSFGLICFYGDNVIVAGCPNSIDYKQTLCNLNTIYESVKTESLSVVKSSFGRNSHDDNADYNYVPIWEIKIIVCRYGADGTKSNSFDQKSRK